MVVTTTLALVIITTVIFGSFMPVVQAILVPPPPEMDEDLQSKLEDDKETEGRHTDISIPFATKSQIDHMSQVVPIPEETNEARTESDGKNKNSKGKKKEMDNGRTTHYDDLVHPNDERSEDPKTQRLLQKKQEQQRRRLKRIEDGEAFDSTDGGTEVDEDERKQGCAFYFNELDKKILKPILVYKYNQEKMERHDQVNDFMLSFTQLLGSVVSNEQFDGEYDYNEDISYGGPS